MKKQIKNVLLITALMLVATMSVVSAEDAPSMYFEPADGNATCGEEITMYLMGNMSIVTTGMQAQIDFDPACINITNVSYDESEFGALAPPGWMHNGSYIRLAGVDFSGVWPGPKILATLTVECVGDVNCTSDLLLSDTEISNGSALDHTVYNGTFTCNATPEEPPEVIAEIGIGNGTGVVTIPITVTNASNVGACDIRMEYNTSVVNVTNVSGVDMDNYEINDEHVGEGWIIVAGYQGNNPGLDGTFTLANVEFEPVGGVDSCQLEIIVRTFKDATPETVVMNYTVSNGTYYSLLNGDVNEDGDVDVGDAMLIAKYVVGLDGYGDINLEAADVTGDGVIDISDAMYLAKHCVGITGFEILR